MVFVQTDVTSFDSQQAAFKAAIEHSPSSSIDIVIPCAGLGGSTIVPAVFPTDLAPDADLPKPDTSTIEVNLLAVYYTACLALHYFKRTKGNSPVSNAKKHLLFVSSLSGYVTQPLFANYMASKFGVRGIFKAIRYNAPELGGDVRFNLIAPCAIVTPMTEQFVPIVGPIGYEFGSIDDAVEGIMRVLCDESIEGWCSTFESFRNPADECTGRASCIAPGKLASGPGTANFDLWSVI